MVNKSIRISLMVIGWLLMTCALRAETIPFLPPDARPQPEANKPRRRISFWYWPITMWKTMPPISAIWRCVPARSTIKSAGCCTMVIRPSACKIFSTPTRG